MSEAKNQGTGNTKPKNNNAGKNNAGKNNTGKNNAGKNEAKKNNTNNSGFYVRNIPILVMVGIFLFFILFQFLKAHKYKENTLKQKIDAEIRKKLYFGDDYY